MKRLLGLILLSAGLGCSDPVAPVTRIEYPLESYGGQALPAVLFVDFEVTVHVLSDVISLGSDSTFMEVAHLRAASPIDTVFTADTVSGTYSVSGSNLYLLMASAQTAYLKIDGNVLRQSFSGGELVYRRR